MKEIDFLPEWYKNGIRRQVNYRLQYIILFGVFMVMIVWNYVSAGSVSRVRAKYIEMENRQTQSEKASVELDKYKEEISDLLEKEKILDNIDSNINVSNVLAELSFLVDEKIVLSKVEFISEKIVDTSDKGKKSQSMSVVRSSVMGSDSGTMLGNVRFRIIIKGVAANASDMAVLLCNLEDSPYFEHANLKYVKESEVKKNINLKSIQQNAINGLTNNQNINSSINLHVSEFEINCYLSNYHINQ